MKKINMLSKAHTVKGQGVLSAHDEQVALAAQLDEFQVVENEWKKSDVIHCHTINPEFLLWCMMHPGSIRVGYVHFLPRTVDGSIRLPSFAKRIFYKYIIYFYKKMDRLVTVNPYFIDLLEEYGIPREKVSYIPNFVSEKQFYPLNQEEKKKIRREYKVKEDCFTVLCVGQLQKRKGFFDYVELAKKNPDLTFVWAGGFPFGKIMDGYEEIQEALKQLPPNLKMLGVIERKKMNRIYNMADVFFLPSYEELFPMTILEAMSCQIPVVVRDLPIYENILFDYCLKGKDTEDFLRFFTQLKENASYYEEQKEKSLQGHSYYSEGRIKMQWDYFYHHICMEREKERAKKRENRKEMAVLWRKAGRLFVQR
ncbi:MAG: glycosyltransferase family 4 protein [Lachnospiraceae bacterium]|nr:glycosyltransferase family 4 protein [Lachnospiraceae bacterium]